MPESNFVFIDTAPFIYLIENNPRFYSIVEDLIVDYVSTGAVINTSVITYMEFCVVPEREGRQDVIDSFRDLMKRLGVNMIEINEEIAQIAYKLRAKYSFLKSMDAIQLACSKGSSCDFITNDVKLKKIDEDYLKIVVLE